MNLKQRISIGAALLSSACSAWSTFVPDVAWKIGMMSVSGVLLGAATIMFALVIKKD